MRSLSTWLAVIVALSIGTMSARANNRHQVSICATNGTDCADQIRVEFGEPFHVVIVVVSNAKLELGAPLPIGERFVEIDRQITRADLFDGSEKQTIDLLVAAYEVGTLEFPRLPIVKRVEGGSIDRSSLVESEFMTGSLSIEVTSLIAGANIKLKPSAPPVSVLESDYRVVWFGCGALGIAIAFAVLRRRGRIFRTVSRRQRGEPVAMDMRTPEELALEKLHVLARSGMASRTFFFNLTDIVREYLGTRFSFYARELTSGELLSALSGTNGAILRDEVESWLGGCDTIKYAGILATREEAQQAFDEAIRLIEKARLVAERVAVGESRHV